MKRIKLILMAVILVVLSRGILAKEVSYTLEDRDRMIRVETKLEEGQKASNQRFDDINRRFDELRGFMLWGFGVTFAGIFSLVGFVLWDRRSVLAPAVKKNKELEEREELLEKWQKKADMALKEYARQDVKLADIMKHAGLL